MADQARDTRAQQSAEREDQMRDRFGLVPGGGGRPGVDAILPLGEDGEIPFEVKSSDGDSVSTARDVGREHIAKWRSRHWLFGFYRRGSRNPPIPERFIYASPRQLEPWIAEAEQYVLPDWQIVRLLPGTADLSVLAGVAGQKKVYTLEDARKILKSQKLEAGEHMTREIRTVLDASGLPEPTKMGTKVYKALMDRPDGFSPERMLVLLHERARYLLDRGATRNNPHIAQSRLLKLVPRDQVIGSDAGRWAQRLEELVRRELQAAKAAATDTATR